MERENEGQSEGSDTPPATAEDTLEARVDDLVRAFATRVAPPIDPAVLDALRAAVLELARAHAARTVLETVTARESLRAAKRQRRPWGGRPPVRRP